MLLSTLIEDAGDAAAAAGWALAGSGDVDITAVVDDHREVVPGALFCCVRGSSVDGHDLAGEAKAAGAVAVVVDRLLSVDLTQVVVPDVRGAMGWIAAVFHGHPSRAMLTVGVTGTNGKTTTTHMIASILETCGITTATIGTLTGARTTPEAVRLQRQFAELVESGTQAVAMEVSSHALDQHRVDGTFFRVGVFTNLSPDHLDYHVTMEAYFEAKALLFERGRLGSAVISIDDEWGRRLIERTTVPSVGVSLVDAGDLALTLDGSAFTWRGESVHLPIPGRFNVMNALLAAEACVALGRAPAEVAAALGTVAVVPGRIERVDGPGDPRTVFVDYAHTPDGLEELLTTLSAVMDGGRLVVVFGCGGDRDRAKRPLMGRAAAHHGDLAIVTSDNPRSEDPDAIIAEVLEGMTGERAEVIVEPDRRAAIRQALERSTPADVVVVAGKGHEATQTVGERVIPFDDRVVVRELLAEGVAP